jgi:hypothetical protein
VIDYDEKCLGSLAHLALAGEMMDATSAQDNTPAEQTGGAP